MVAKGQKSRNKSFLYTRNAPLIIATHMGYLSQTSGIYQNINFHFPLTVTMHQKGNVLRVDLGTLSKSIYPTSKKHDNP